MTLLSFRVIFGAALVALIAAPLSSFLTRRLKLIDIPNSAPHKLHRAATPIGGGMTILATLLVIGIWQNIWASQTVLALSLSSGVIFIFGLLDDKYNLPVLAKLAGQLAATGLLIWMGVQVLLFHQNWVNLTLTALWVVGITNAYNFVDSMDGLAVGLGVQAAAFFMLVTNDSGQADLSLLSTILLGAGLGCYYFNAAPARFFLGDSGSQFLGFLMAGLAIAYNPPGFEPLASWYVPILLMGVPIFDISLVIVSRLRRHKAVYQSSRDHTYHRLVALGMSSNRAVLTMHVVALLLGCLAFIALDMQPLVSNLIFGLVILSGILALVFLDRKSQPLETD
jgi:UDP-GlcNAc:undecaprenyl-phosphate GlcNAc-1-phosphate transferase